MTEASRLSSIAINCYGPPRERLRNKVWNCATITKAHSLVVSIEDSRDSSPHAGLLLERRRPGFRVTLSFIVSTPRAGWVHKTPICFRPRFHLRITVDFLVACEEQKL